MAKIENYLVCGEKIKVWHPETIGAGFCISMGTGGWLDGSFDSIESALKGAEHNLKLTAVFFEIQKKINHVDQENRLITLNDLADI
mgnify:CR=1 FL=1